MNALSSPNRAMQVCDAMCFCNRRCEARDFRALDEAKTSDLCIAICIAGTDLCNAMHFRSALAAEIHCDVGRIASITLW